MRGNQHRDDRRRYFRIDDRVQLHFRLLTEAQMQQRLQRPVEEDGSTLGSQLRELSAQMGKMLITIRKSNPDIAQYLTLLDRKIDILSRQLEQDTHGELAPDTPVNLGGGGLAFWNAEAIALGTGLELQLVLFPSLQRIQALGRVAHCDEDPQGPNGRRWRIGVEFARITEADQDTLLRHLIERQSAQLRHQRGR